MDISLESIKFDLRSITLISLYAITLIYLHIFIDLILFDMGPWKNPSDPFKDVISTSFYFEQYYEHCRYIDIHILATFMIFFAPIFLIPIVSSLYQNPSSLQTEDNEDLLYPDSIDNQNTNSSTSTVETKIAEYLDIPGVSEVWDSNPNVSTLSKIIIGAPFIIQFLMAIKGMAVGSQFFVIYLFIYLGAMILYHYVYLYSRLHGLTTVGITLSTVLLFYAALQTWLSFLTIGCL